MTEPIHRNPISQAPETLSGIKSWAKDDRPREKLLIKGVQALSDAELLAILIRTGHFKKSAVEVAKDLLGLVNHNLKALGLLNAKELMKMKGIGEAKAITLLAALELGRRRQAGNPLEKPAIRQSGEAAALLQPLLADYRQEVFAVLFLNRANRVNHFEIVSSGGMTGTIVDRRIILRKALENNAVSLLLCHNHPSGNLEPSRADRELTRRICEAAALLDIRVTDHLIVSDTGYYSFADEGLL